jgi:hypothetical protein
MAVDIKEWLITNIGSVEEDSEGKSSIVQAVQSYAVPSVPLNLSIVQSIIPTVKKTRHHYFSIERSNALNPTDTNKFKYWINPYPIRTEQGMLNTFCPVKNITAMRLTNVYMTIRTLANQELLKHKKLTVLIEELSGQSLMGFNGNKFHFVLEYYNTENNIARFSTYNANRGLFIFNKIIRYLDTLTVTIYDETDLFPMENSVYTVAVTSHLVYTLLTIPITTPYFYTPEMITLSGFSTNNPIGDAALIAACNTNHTIYRSLYETTDLVNSKGLVQIFVDGTIFVINFTESNLIPDSLVTDLYSVNIATGGTTPLITNTYQVGAVLNDVYNDGYLTINMGINLNVFTITYSTTDGLINSTLVYTYIVDTFVLTANNTHLLYYIRLPIDSSAVVITTPSILLSTPVAKLEMQLELQCEED